MSATFDREYEARDYARRMNIESSDSCRDCPPRIFYFVRPISRKLFEEAQEERFRKCKEKKMKQQGWVNYQAALQSFATEMVPALVFILEDSEQVHSLRSGGGWTEPLGRHVEGIGNVTISVFFSAYSGIYLQAHIEKYNEPVFVESFYTVNVLRSWLLNTKRAASDIVSRIIQVLNDLDRLRAQAEKQARR